jgi:putative oxidoreductase
MSQLKKIIQTRDIPTILIRLVVGLIFLTEGIQKFLFPDALGTGRFTQIGFTHPAFWAYFVACVEIVCGALLILGLLTRLAAIPLIIDMAVAFITTKIPILMSKGIWVMMHEYRVDFAVTMLSIFLLIYGGGKFSIDYRIFHKAE